MTGDDTIVRRFSDAMQRRGTQVTLRSITTAGGVNPPSVVGAVLNGAAAAGARTISIRATSATGRIARGDTVTIGTLAPNVVAADVAAIAPPLNPSGAAFTPGFVAVQLTTPLPSAVADGTALSFAWLADTQPWATITNYQNTVQNADIIAGDFDVCVAAYGIVAPNATSQILIGGVARTIVNAVPVYQRGLVVAYKIHAR